MTEAEVSYSRSGFKGMQEKIPRTCGHACTSYSLSGFKGMQEDGNVI